METRPKIKLTLSPLDNMLELTAKIFFVMMWGFTIYAFFTLPTIIPIHYNTSGQADNYGNKITLLLLPVFGTLIYLGLTQLNKYPHIFNYMTQITEGNAERQYTIAARMFRFLKLAVLIIFSLLILFTYLTTISAANGLGVWFLPLTFALLLFPTIISIKQSLSNK